MKLFTSLAIVVLLLAMMVLLHKRSSNKRTSVDARTSICHLLLASISFLLVLDQIAGRCSLVCIANDMMLLLIPSFLLISSSYPVDRSIRSARLFIFLIVILAVSDILALFGILRPLGEKASAVFSTLLGLLAMSLYVRGLWLNISDMRMLMKSGTVWRSLSAGVDSVYAAGLLLISLMPLLGYGISPFMAVFLSVLSIICALLTLTALGERMVNESCFVIMKDQERKIVESLKISQIEVQTMPRDDIYRDIYDRIVDYFESEKPFLNNELTINDIVRYVYSNKLYISRAISQYTGRNFCQFVNYYRVIYSMECFRNNPDLRISELAERSGFNTPVSYNMAFRLFMNENPSDWCRKEKHKLRKKKK